MYLSWNPRLKARWAREEEDNRHKAKIIHKTPTSAELREIVTVLLNRRGELDLETIEKDLHLDTMGKIRLFEILTSCEKKGAVNRQNIDNRIVFKKTNREAT
jgi:hypothetical protein